MKGKKLNLDMPNLIYNENEPGQPIDDTLITTLERYHDNHESKECRSYKYLRIHLDEHLTLDTHTSHIVNKLTSSMYCIKQAKHIIPESGLKSLYFALIHSYLLHCTAIMSVTTLKNRQRIIKIQKKALRLISNSAYNAHTAPLFLRYNILPYEKLILFSQLNFMHAINYSYAPSSFANTWLKNTNRLPERNLRNADEYTLTQPRTELFKRSTFYAMPVAWNTLAPEIKLQQNRTTFRWALKAHLLTELDEN